MFAHWPNSKSAYYFLNIRELQSKGTYQGSKLRTDSSNQASAKHGLLSFTAFIFYFLFFFILSFSAPTDNPFSGLTAEPMGLGSPNLGQGSTLMMPGSTLKIKVIGQRSRVTRSKTVSAETLPGLIWINAYPCR